MKNVLIIIGKLKIGGAERVARDIGYFNDIEKYKIHYIVFEDEIGVYEEELKDIGCIIHHLDPPAKSYLNYLKRLKKIIKTERIDVVHSHTMFNSGWAMLAAKLCGVPVRIAHSHTIKGPEKRSILKQNYENIMRRIILRNATLIVACGKGAGNWLYGEKEFRKRGILIYNGIDLSSFWYSDIHRSTIRMQHGMNDCFVIGHVGHLATVKNQVFLLELLPDILKYKPNTILLLLGDGKDREMLQCKITELGLSDHVIMTGNVNNVGEYMSAMDVLAFPSLYEGMPLTLVEAQANGLPCVISDCIPTDICITNLVKRISLKQNDKWLDELMTAKRHIPNQYYQKMFDLGFDITEMVKKVYSLYG